MRTTTQCPGCQAPVSVGEPACWSCGGGLTRPPAAVPTPPPKARRPVPPGPYSRTCPACRETIALYHRTCPVCGQEGTPPTVALTPPAGWIETLSPDGSVRLQRTRKGRTDTVLAPLIIAGALLLSDLGRLLDPRVRRVQLPPDAELVEGICTAVLLVCGLLILAGCLAWLRAGEERWIIRNGLLEVHRECLGRKWSRSYAAAELSLEPHYYAGQSRPRQSWRLVARGVGADQTIATTAVYGVTELSALGGYLSARTGWRWRPPQDLHLLSTLLGPSGW